MIISIAIVAAIAVTLMYMGKPTVLEVNGTATMEPRTLENGLVIEDVVIGEGDEIKAGDTAVMHYTGTFDDGSKFDSSLDRGTPFEFVLGSGMVIQGWEQGIPGMRVGGKRKLTIPYELGYGENGYGPIPAKATLHFDVELVGIK